MPLKVLVGLILCNLVWSANPAMAKLVLADSSPALAAWSRYFFALIAYFFMLPGLRGSGLGPAFLRPRSRNDLLLASGLGFMVFCFAPLMQMTGLHSSRATDNALIIAMEPLMTVALARVFLGEKLATSHVIAFATALTGFTLLSGVGVNGMSAGTHLLANFLMLIALVGEASYSILGRKLLDRYSPLASFGTVLFSGVLFLTISTAWIDGIHVFSGIAHLGWKAWAALFWLGPLGTTLSYFFWMQALKEATVASLVLTLFIQPVFGSIWGYLFLEERLSETQVLGSLLIITAVLAQSAIARWQAAVVSASSLRQKSG